MAKYIKSFFIRDFYKIIGFQGNSRKTNNYTIGMPAERLFRVVAKEDEVKVEIKSWDNLNFRREVTIL